MYQSEALWIGLDGTWVDKHGTEYPFAVKVAAGKIDAVTGKTWTNELGASPQNYMVVPEQPWLELPAKGYVTYRAGASFGESTRSRTR